MTMLDLKLMRDKMKNFTFSGALSLLYLVTNKKLHLVKGGFFRLLDGGNIYGLQIYRMM